MLLLTLDLLGTAIFALTGALEGVRHRLDLLGILVLSAITGVGGGVLRDVILGKTPPAAFQNELYLICSLTVGLFVFFLIPLVNVTLMGKVWNLILIGDALGLGVFTLIGATKGIEAGLGPVGIMFTGAVTSCGGGMLRDILVREVPALLKRDFYATASIMGSLVLLLLLPTPLPSWMPPTIAVIFTTFLRLFAMKKKLNLPIPRAKGDLSDRIC